MTTPLRELVISAVENPKTSMTILTFTSVERFWLEWGSWVVDAGYSIASLVLVFLLIYRQYRAIKKENKIK